jgi:predicted ATP-grasp superfamily ATP-dependent carboligase
MEVKLILGRHYIVDHIMIPFTFFYRLTDRVKNWLEDNEIEYIVDYDKQVIIFNDDADAVAFKIKWS